MPSSHRRVLTFAVGECFRAQGTGFHPEAPVVFEVKDPAEHHHVPLLVSPFEYSTYRIRRVER